LAPLLTGSWLGFWGFALLGGAVAGAVLWYVGGWWYRVRLKWAGADNPDPTLARLVYIYSGFVVAGPMVAAALLQTITFPSYRVASEAETLYPFLLLAFPLWSIVVSYNGVTARFAMRRWAARMWFLILPGLLYAFAFGAVAVFYSVLGKAA
jgi:hypothetical protein